MTVKVACIGTGNVTVQNHIPGLLLHPETEIVALCDSSRASLEKAAAAIDGARTYTDYRQVLECDDIDAIVIATPNNIHKEIATAAARRGIHVMSDWLPD